MSDNNRGDGLLSLSEILKDTKIYCVLSAAPNARQFITAANHVKKLIILRCTSQIAKRYTGFAVTST
jgi:hypothetical protein